MKENELRKAIKKFSIASGDSFENTVNKLIYLAQRGNTIPEAIQKMKEREK